MVVIFWSTCLRPLRVVLLILALCALAERAGWLPREAWGVLVGHVGHEAESAATVRSAVRSGLSHGQECSSSWFLSVFSLRVAIVWRSQVDVFC